MPELSHSTLHVCEGCSSENREYDKNDCSFRPYTFVKGVVRIREWLTANASFRPYTFVKGVVRIKALKDFRGMF